MELSENSFYVLKDQFFEDFKDCNLIHNKSENRPFYYCIRDKVNPYILWVIPISSKVEKFKRLIENDMKKYKKCNKVHICKAINEEVRAFLIQDMFPIIEEYILREYTKNGVHSKLCDNKNEREIKKKAQTMIAIRRKGITYINTQPDVLKIQSGLLNIIEQHGEVAQAEEMTEGNENKHD